MTLPEWFNGSFILAFTGLLGGGISYLLVFCLKSRCREVECCCIKCVRDVIPAESLPSVSVVPQESQEESAV